MPLFALDHYYSSLPDYYHGVCHARFLEGVSELIRSNGYLGMFSLVKEMPEVQKYLEATEFDIVSYSRTLRRLSRYF